MQVVKLAHAAMQHVRALASRKSLAPNFAARDMQLQHLPGSLTDARKALEPLSLEHTVPSASDLQRHAGLDPAPSSCTRKSQKVKKSKSQVLHISNKDTNQGYHECCCPSLQMACTFCNRKLYPRNHLYGPLGPKSRNNAGLRPARCGNRELLFINP